MRCASSLWSNLLVISAWLLIVLIFVGGISAFEQRRCFRCRSRGGEGDCRDPFTDHGGNVSAIVAASHSNGIHVEPCASGWCRKTIEGDTDYLSATDRQCMQRPPSDLNERCDLVRHGRSRTVFMCMCRGDLCNSAPRPGHVTGSLLFACTAGSLLLFVVNFSR